MVKAINSAYVALAVVAALAQNVAAHQPHLNHRDLAAHHRALEKKDFVERQLFPSGLFPSDTDTNTGPTGPGGTGGTGGTGGNDNTTTSPTTTLPTTTEPTTTQPTTTDPPTTTSSTSNTSTSTPSTTSTSQTSAAQNTQTTTTPRAANTGSTYVNTARVTSLRASTTATGEDTPAPSSSDTPFFKNKSAVAATFTVVAIVGFGIIVFIIVWLKKKSQREKMAEEDMWDEAGMTEFTRPPPDVTPPSPAVIAGGGLGRKNTVLPSQSAGAMRAQRSSPDPYGDEPDEILAVPPVMHYERPRDSAFDIVPAGPPPAAMYGGASGSMQPPRRDHTSFGSGLGNDPFAGTGFVDATRESGFSGGQAGRGAGYNMPSYEPQHNGGVAMGNQWPQGYNPYNGYAQGNEEAYGGAYGGHGYAH